MKIVAANRLSDGETVWLGADDRWVANVQEAQIARDGEAENRLFEAGRKAVAGNRVLDATLIDVELVEGRILPIRLRERIRAAGPSIHADLGKQARPGAVTAL